MEKQGSIRYGIIGFGLFAEKTILPAFRAAQRSTLTAIQKRDRTRAFEMARKHGVRHACATAEELASLADVDAVFVASANCDHYPSTVVAARAGKHVIVEKPMALTPTEAEEMIRICEEHNVLLMVGHMVRFSPVVNRVKEMVLSGMLGRVTAIRTEFVYDARLTERPWLYDARAAGGGPLFDIGVHCLDTIRYVLNDEPVSVQSLLVPHPTRERTESTALLTLQFSKGTPATIFCSYDSPLRRSSLEVIGTEGTLVAEHFTRSSTTVRLLYKHRQAGAEPSEKIETFDVHNLYTEEIDLFTDAILTHGMSPIPGSEGLANQRILDQALMQQSSLH